MEQDRQHITILRGTSTIHIHIIYNVLPSHMTFTFGCSVKVCHVQSGRRRDAQHQQATAFLDGDMLAVAHGSQTNTRISHDLQ